jgi:phospholipid transport system substrate-binding protein
MKKRNWYVILLALLPLATEATPYHPSQAAPYYPPKAAPYPGQAQPHSGHSALAELAEPAQVLRSGIELLTGYLDRSSNIPPPQLQAYLEEKIVPYFDFERMAYWTAGPLNRKLDSGQKDQLRVMLKNRFLTAMAEQLSHYQNSRIQYLRPKGNIYSGEVTLGVRVFSRNQPPVQVDFKLYQGRDGWKVYDVVANGMSALNHYRKEFTGIARRYGIQGLLARLGQ